MVKRLLLSKALFLIAFIVGLGVTGVIFNTRLFAQDSVNQKEDPVQIKELVCYAKDPQSLHQCISEAKNKIAPIIKINAPVHCKSAEECRFDLSTISEGVMITSSTPADKIVRSNHYNYPLFMISNSSQIYLQDLIIEDQDRIPCAQGVICPPVIQISNSNGISIKNVHFKNTHGSAISAVDTSKLVISHSDFMQSLRNGIEISSTKTIEEILIERNKFNDNASHAIHFQATSAGGSPAKISQNIFTNNHAHGAYDTRANCTFPCVGSQLKMEGPTTNVAIYKNEFLGGVNTVFDTVGLYTSGVEIGSQNISSVSLSCNSISYNRGSAIVQSRPVSNSKDIIISKNKVWDNGIGINVVEAKVEKDNCYTESCKLECD